MVGLARSDANAETLKAAGAEVHRGSLENLDSLRRSAAEADGTIHLAFIQDFSKFAENGQIEVLARHLNVPAASIRPEDAPAYFGWLAMFAGTDAPASSALTQKRLGWRPTQIGLIADIGQPGYLRAKLL